MIYDDLEISNYYNFGAPCLIYRQEVFITL